MLECVPAELAERISALLDIPTIGIGAGVGCDGQVQVFHDILGLGEYLPKHARRWANLGQDIEDAVSAYASEVRGRTFPGNDQSTHINASVLAEAEVRYSAEYAEAGDEEYLP